MKEYFTPGIVLERNPRGEFDETITIYTKDLGKISAFTKSSRKITSKRSGHLIPGKFAQVRLVHKNNLQLVDSLALKFTSNPRQILPFLNFLDKILPYGEPDLALWYFIEEIIKQGRFNLSVYRRLLQLAGFLGEELICENCRREAVSFLPTETIFLCSGCAHGTNIKIQDELIFLGKE